MILTLLTVLQFTIPSTGQAIWTDPAAGEDSVHYECDGGPPVGVDSVKLYRWSNGDFRFVRGHYVRGREGAVDTFVVGLGSYRTGAKNSKGEDCGQGNVVNVVGDPTSVPEQEMNGVVDMRIFDVAGRDGRRLRNGIMFRVITYRDGHKCKEVVLRLREWEKVLRRNCR